MKLVYLALSLIGIWLTGQTLIDMYEHGFSILGFVWFLIFAYFTAITGLRYAEYYQ